MPLLNISGEKVPISVSLDIACGYELSFLKSVNEHPELFNQDFLKTALYRYEVFWLPLTAKHDSQILIAPLDIEWIWHCHMLAPVAYAEDCMTVVGKLINHCLFSEQYRNKHLKKSKDAWQKMYPSQPFENLPDANDEIKYDYESKLSYDLLSATLRQKSFFYQVSLPHFTDYKFLKQASLRYKMFLLLKKKNPNSFLVPSYDIDLMWHSHQLHPVSYANDTTKLFQRVFNHDDSVNDRSPNSKLNVCQADTYVLWKDAYSENYAMSGAMYRGNPPDGKLYKITREDLFRVCYKTSKFVVKKVKVENIPANMTKFHVAMALTQKVHPVTVKKLKGPSQEWEGKSLLKSEISTISKCLLDVSLFNKFGVACCGDTVTLGKCSFDLQTEIHLANEGQTFNKKLTLNENTQTSVEVMGQYTTPIISGCKFTVKTQLYTKCTMPLNIEEMWGPVPLPQQASESENCNVAEHLLFNSMQMKEFTCRIVHCLQLDISVIQVYFHDKMAVVGHLIGVGQLPSDAQVAYPDCCVTLNPEKGERAVLIKNHYGDWGVVVGKWEGVRKGVAGIPGSSSQKGVKGVPGSPGHLTIGFFEFTKKYWKKVIIPYDKKDYVLRMHPLIVDMFKGEIFISVENKGDEVAEYLAVAFSVGLLHVLCQPHATNWTPGTKVTSSSTTSREVNHIPSDSMALVIAGGYCVDTPSNFYYSQRKKECMTGAVCGCAGYLYTADIACVDAGGCGGCGGCGG